MKPTTLLIGLLWAIVTQAQLLPFCEQGRWGLIDSTGKRLVSGADSVIKGRELYAIWQNGRATLWNIHNKKAIIKDITDWQEIPGGLIVGKSTASELRDLDGRYAMAIQPGKTPNRYIKGWLEFIEDEYKKGLYRPGAATIQPHYQGFSFVGPFIWADTAGRYVLYDSLGHRLHKLTFDKVEQPYRGLVLMRSGNLIGLIDIHGKWVLEPDNQLIERYGDYIRYKKMTATEWEQKSLKPGDPRKGLLLGTPDPLLALDLSARSNLWAATMPDNSCTQDSMLVMGNYFDSVVLVATAVPGSAPGGLTEVILGTSLKLVTTLRRQGSDTKPRKLYGLYQFEQVKAVLPTVLHEVCYEDFITDSVARCLTYTGRHIWVTATGKVIHPAGRLTKAFRQGYAPACADCRIAEAFEHGKCNHQYDLCNRLTWRDTRPWKDRYRDVAFSGGKWGLLGPNGQWLVQPIYDMIDYPNDGMVGVMLNGKAGILEMATGKVKWLNSKTIKSLAGVEGVFVVSDSVFRFELPVPGSKAIAVVTGQAIGTPQDGLVPVRDGRKWGIKLLDNTWLVEPQFDDLGLFSGNLAPVRKGIFWGYLSRTGEMVVPCKYIIASDFHGAYAVVRNSTRYGVIDTLGNWVVEPTFLRVTAIQGDLMIAGSNSRYGLFTLGGETIIPANYRSLDFCGQWVRISDGPTFGYAHTDGTILCPPRFSQLAAMTAQGAIGWQNGKRYRIGPDGEISADTTQNYVQHTLTAPAPIASLQQGSFKDGRQLFSVYSAYSQSLLAENVLVCQAASPTLIRLSGPDWSSYIRPNGAWLLLPAGLNMDDLAQQK